MILTKISQIMINPRNKTEYKKGVYTHVVKVPKVLINFHRNQIGVVIYNLMNNLHLLDDLKQQELQEEYSCKTQVRLQVNERFEKVLDFICHNENITIKQVITLGLILVKDDVSFFAKES